MTNKPQETVPGPMLTAIRNCISSQRAHLAALQELSDLFHDKSSPIRHLTIEEITVMCLRDKALIETNSVWRGALNDAARIVEGKK